ncbi:MAG TPA: T9SS type A sorting domain-containing protein [Candidatus Cloacimonadota bacterium]|nr:T9SS type A sorting domain-containing protein [Candidatus Cloacimonadota bacterium]
MKSSLYAILTACFLFVSLHLLGAVPPVPALLPATNVTHDSFTANWSSVLGADGYDLEVREGASSTVLSTGFEGSSDFPNGWSASGAIVYTFPTLTVDGSNLVVMNISGGYVQTPILSSPERIVFWTRASGNSSSFTIKIQSSSDLSTWTTHKTLTANGNNSGDIINSYREITITPSLTGSNYLRFLMETRSSGNAYIDVVSVQGGLGSSVAGYYPYNASSNIVQVQGLSSAAIFSYRVRSFNNDGYSLYSDWLTTQTIENTLPVQLTSFTAAQINLDFVRLRWATESETNLLGYHILRGEDSEPHSARIISPLIPAGNSSQPRQYSFDDHDLTTPGTYCYWLEVAEITGSSETFGPVVQHYNPSFDDSNTAPVLQGFTRIYPNPFGNSILMKFTAESSPIVLNIYNLRGQRVQGYEILGEPGIEQTLQWDGKDTKGESCPSGVYWAILQIGETRHVRKLTLSK